MTVRVQEKLLALSQRVNLYTPTIQKSFVSILSISGSNAMIHNTLNRQHTCLILLIMTIVSILSLLHRLMYLRVNQSPQLVGGVILPFPLTSQITAFYIAAFQCPSEVHLESFSRIFDKFILTYNRPQSMVENACKCLVLVISIKHFINSFLLRNKNIALPRTWCKN